MNIDVEASVTDVERMRPRLLALAYRMLGSVADAEDAVQDAYLRFQQAAGVDLARRLAREGDHPACASTGCGWPGVGGEYVGPWLPEPIAEAWDGRRATGWNWPSRCRWRSWSCSKPCRRGAGGLPAAGGLRLRVRGDRRAAGQDPRERPADHRPCPEAARRAASGDSGRSAARPTTWRAGSSPPAGRATSTAIESMLAPDVGASTRDGGGKAHAAPRPIAGPRRIANLLAVVYPQAPAVSAT